MHTTHEMKLSRNGQISLPASVRARWQSDRMVVVDLGEYVVVRPASSDPTTELAGKYAGRGPDSTTMRRNDRADDVRREREHR